jgi:hypothetical protein
MKFKVSFSDDYCLEGGGLYTTFDYPDCHVYGEVGPSGDLAVKINNVHILEPATVANFAAGTWIMGLAEDD